MGRDMDLEHLFIVKVANMLVIGDKIKCMEKEFYIIQTKK
jgi:hypothetical protein